MIERDSSINNSYLYLNVPQSNSVAWNSLLGWAFTKVSQISSTSNLSGKSMAITARSEKRSSDIVDLVQVLIRFMSEKDRSASTLLIGRVHAIRRRRWMFGKVSSSHAPSANKIVWKFLLCWLPHSLPSSQLISKGFGKWKVILPEQHAFCCFR